MSKKQSVLFILVFYVVLSVLPGAAAASEPQSASISASATVVYPVGFSHERNLAGNSNSIELKPELWYLRTPRYGRTVLVVESEHESAPNTTISSAQPFQPARILISDQRSVVCEIDPADMVALLNRHSQDITVTFIYSDI